MAMAELKLGNKFECFRCGTKFYDLGKSSALCPKCGADQKDAAHQESAAATQAARRKKKVEVVRVPVEEEEESTETMEVLEAELEGADLGTPVVEEAEEEEVDDEE